jgi:hypothetical protein
LIFSFNWRNFESLQASFPKAPQHGFEVAFQENYFGLKGVTTTDTTKVNNFLDDVSLLTATEFANRPVFDDSLSKPSPAMIITVRDIAQRTYTLELYGPSGTAEPTIPGLINGKQWAYFSAEKVKEIFKTKAFFTE